MISVIIPALNACETIRETIQSIISQEYNDIELIIVDDGSSDGTASIIDKVVVSDDRVCVIHTCNIGVYLARLLGLYIARGCHITFVDSDDLLLDGIYSRIAEIFETKKADVICFGYYRKYRSGRIKNIENRVVGSFDSNEALIRLIEGKLSPSLCDKAFKRELFISSREQNQIRKDIRINEDFLMNYYIMNNAEHVVGLNESYYVWIERVGSATTKSLDKHRIYDPINVKKFIFDNCSEQIKDTAKKRYIGTLINTYNTLVIDGGTKNRSDIYKVRSLLREYSNCKELPMKKMCQKWVILNLPYLYDVVIIVHRRFHHNTEFSEKG